VKTLILGGILAACLAASAGPAAARDIPAGGLTLDETVAWLRRAGYPATPHPEDGVHPYVSSKLGTADFAVRLYDCKTGGRCASLQFTAGFDLANGLSLDRVNAWNMEKRYVKAYLDDERDPFAGYDINLSPGVTYEALDDAFLLWRSFLPDFTAFIGWK